MEIKVEFADIISLNDKSVTEDFEFSIEEYFKKYVSIGM